MENELIVGFLGAVLSATYYWGFRKLPGERWQVLACIPGHKTGPDLWSGINLTYYGFFSANAYILAALIMIVLTGADGIPVEGAISILIVIFGTCIPASRILARTIEKKKFTFTVGGACFTGMLLLPIAILIVNETLGTAIGFHIPFMAALSAAAVSYAFGEGAGRLACISFGCCYGNSVARSGPLIRRIFERQYFIFTGKTKKIAYESALDGEKVIPVQAISAVVNTAAGLVGMYLHLYTYFGASFLLTVVATQAWRVFSETMRKDHRGEGKLTAYQWMGLAMIPYALALFILLPSGATVTNIYAGLENLWNPALIISLQLLWLYIFIRTGRSRVTGSHLSLCIHPDRI